MLTTEEMRGYVDILENEHQEIEASFSALQQRLQFGNGISETDLESLNELQDSLAQLQDNIDHHIERCRIEGDPGEIYIEKDRLDRLRHKSNLTGIKINKQLESSEKRGVSKPKSKLSRTGKVTVKVAKKAIKSGWKVGKRAFNQVNPINKSVNRNATSDHGVESLRMANSIYKTGKKAIKTTKTTVKTTNKSIKLAESTAKRSYRTVKQTAIITYKVVKTTASVVKKAVIALATLASFPLFWIILAILVVVVLMINAVAVLLGGAASVQEQEREAATDPVALDENIPEDIQDALEYFRIATENQKTEYTDMINGYAYDTDNLRESDLVYEVRNNPPATYEKSLATPGRKSTLCNAWRVGLNEPEALAIVYVLLERAENEANGTELELYPIEYTQEAFDGLLDMCCVYTDTVFPGQECPDRNCSLHHEAQPNPAYATALNAYNREVNAYNSFFDGVAPKSAEYRRRLEAQNNAPNPAAQSAMQEWVDQAKNELTTAFRSWEAGYEYTGWEINAYMDINCLAWLGASVEAAQRTLESTPQTTQTDYYTCDHVHDLHSVGLNIFNADETMNRYSFSEAERQWAENLTQTYTAYFAYLEAEGGG